MATFTQSQVDAHQAKVSQRKFMRAGIAEEVMAGASSNLYERDSINEKPTGGSTPPPAPISKRIRQSDNPLMNKLEADWFSKLEAQYPEVRFRAQAIRFMLARGAWYKPDMSAFMDDTLDNRLICWECKGGKKMKGHAKGMLTIKVAATAYPEVRFILVWRENGQWQTQEVYP